MSKKVLRLVPWLFALVALAAISVLVVRNVLWQPEHRKKLAAAETPHWPAAKSDEEADVHSALTLENEGKLDEALAAYTRLLEKEPDSWFLLGTRASCYEKMGDFPKAVEDLRRLAALKKRGSNPHWRMARLLLLMGKRDEARAEAEASIKQDPDLADPYRVLAELEAERDLEKSVELLESYLQRAWTGAAQDSAERTAVEDKLNGTYIQRLTEMYRRTLPESERRDVQAQLEARWHAANKYTDITPLWTTKYKTLEHLTLYLTLAKAHGDPNRERHAQARELVKRLKADIRKEEQASREAVDPTKEVKQVGPTVAQ